MEQYPKYMLSAVRALLGAITGNVRAVLLGWTDEKIHLKFITYADPTEKDFENLYVAGTEIAADFPHMDVVETIEMSNAYPMDLPDSVHKHMVFSRSDDEEPET